jgi:glyoxylase-like metal-dependent hydrolase (beta-lactamase superfamily II)
MRDVPDRQVPGIYHRQVGDIVLTALSDGFQDVSMATVLNIAPEEAAAILRAAFRPVPRRTAVNAFLIRSAGRMALVDAGCGNGGQATSGKLAANLAAAGVDPAEIDTVLMTHLHPDHFGGLVRPDGSAVFPRATLWLHGAEYHYWHNEDAAQAVTDPARRALFFGGARNSLLPYAGRIECFEGEHEIFPSVTTLPLPGHTPGHSGYHIRSGGEELLIWGDIVHVQELQVSRPEVSMMVDVAREPCIATRLGILARVARERLTVAGMHLHFPGIANIVQGADGYRLLPEAWRTEL